MDVSLPNDGFVPITDERDYRPDWRKVADRPEAPGDLPSTESPSLVMLMPMTREEWERGSPIRRAGYTRFKRNVAVRRDALEA